MQLFIPNEEKYIPHFGQQMKRQAPENTLSPCETVIVLHRSGGFADSAETEYYAFQIP